MTIRTILCSFLCCVFFSSLVLAEGEGRDIIGAYPQSPAPEVLGVRPLGMGGAGTALADGTAGMLLNPAGLRVSKSQVIGEGGGFFNTGANSFALHVAIVDSKSNKLIAGGGSYTYYVEPREDDGKVFTVSGHLVRAGFAMSYRDILYLGFTFKYANLTLPFLAPGNFFNGDLGLIWRIFKPLTLSVVGYNLLYNDSGEFPISLGFGLAFNQSFGNHAFRLAADGIVDFTRPGGIGYEVRTGAEYVFGKILGLRIGYTFDEVRKVKDEPRHYFTVGLTFKYSRFGLEFAYRQQMVNAPLDANRYFGITARLYF